MPAAGMQKYSWLHPFVYSVFFVVKFSGIVVVEPVRFRREPEAVDPVVSGGELDRGQHLLLPGLESFCISPVCH
jgi:hypothetical protein